MASVAKRPNGKWRARVTLPDGRQRARHFARKTDAEAWLAEQVVRLRDGSWIDPRRGRRTFGEYAETWLEHQVHHRASTSDATALRLRVHVLPRFADAPLASITRSDVQSWVRALSQRGLAPSYVEGLYRLMAQVMLAAREDGMLAVTPCRKVKLPEVVRPPLLIPTVDEVRALVEVAPERARALVLTAAGTGMRLGEVTGLTLDRVDFLRRQIRVDQQLISRSGVSPHLGPPKTPSSVRTIPIADELALALARHVEGRGIGEGLLFVTAHDRPWRRGSIWAEWTRRAKRAGVNFTPHDLRHFYASALIAAGLSVKVVQERLGHSKATTTLDIYGHLWNDDDDRTREASGELLRGVLGDSGTVEGPAERLPRSGA